MTAYNFKAQFATDVKSGKKLQTIRKVGKRKPPKAGSELQLYTGMRTKNCRLLARAVCTSVRPVQIDTRLMLVLLYAGDQCPPLKIDGQWLVDLAKADGFASVEEFFLFFESQCHPHDQGVLFGHLISWRPSDEVA